MHSRWLNRRIAGWALIGFVVALGVSVMPVPTVGAVTAPKPATQAALSLTVDRGEGGAYVIGDAITLLWNVDRTGDRLRIIVQSTDGVRPFTEFTTRELAGAIAGRVGAPEGQHTLMAELYDDQSGGAVIATAQTWFTALPATQTAAGPTPTTPPLAQHVIIGANEFGRTVTVPVGSTIEISFLDKAYDWEPFQYDSYVLQLETAPGLFPIIFRAKNPGQSTISSSGSAPCRKTTPPCMLPDRLFRVLVIVQ